MTWFQFVTAFIVVLLAALILHLHNRVKRLEPCPLCKRSRHEATKHPCADRECPIWMSGEMR